MATGRILPIAPKPLTSDRVFRTEIGTNVIEPMMGVQASVGADSIWFLTFPIPETLPSGTLKLKLRMRTLAITGNARVNPKWNVATSLTDIENVSTFPFNAEGATTIAAPGTALEPIETIITLANASSLANVVAGGTLYMKLTFEQASWTLAAISGWEASIFWV